MFDRGGMLVIVQQRTHAGSYGICDLTTSAQACCLCSTSNCCTASSGRRMKGSDYYPDFNFSRTCLVFWKTSRSIIAHTCDWLAFWMRVQVWLSIRTVFREVVLPWSRPSFSLCFLSGFQDTKQHISFTVFNHAINHDLPSPTNEGNKAQTA